MKKIFSLLFILVLINSASAGSVARVNDAQIRELAASDHRVVMHFWATWCVPCVEEVPMLNQLHKKFPTVEFVAVSVDDLENEGAIGPFLKKHPIDFKVMLREGKEFKTMAQTIDPGWEGGIPTTFVFEKGKRIYSCIGKPDQQDELERILSKTP